MKVYPVPFSTKEEDKLIFNLSTKQSLIIGASVILALITAGLLTAILQTQMLFCLPIGLPVIFVGVILAMKKIEISGCEMTTGDYLFYRYKYSQRKRHYLTQRGEGETKWYF